MSFGGSLVFILAMTLLFTGVISMSIQVPLGEAVAVTPTVANGSGTEKYNLKPNELEVDSNEMDLTEGDDSWDNIGAIIPNLEDLDSPQDNRTEGVNKEQGITVWGSPNTSKPSIAEEENLKMIADEEEGSLALLSLLVKRAVEEDYEAGESETILDEDDFSFSDLPKIFEPLIKAFSGSPTSEPPSPEDFFSWFPSLKELLDPPREEPASVTSSPRKSITPPTRRSAVPTLLEPSLQMAPAIPSAQPNEAESLPFPSSLEESITSIIPTLPTPPQTSERSLSDVSDSEERFD
ncbi:uncharacterized protein LOC107295801 [Protobothrops mucrosquamatus]|uniref:uncharacterized protein LOC107295801 n=1 Tax=Protobothrops mucrosquamatus TaxID=103944 RepID=UPI000775B195|nr:uncharacterized protein LOC107295801 [Protobothrops mucrosquamatus]